MKKNTVLIIVLVVIGIVCGYGCSTYNKLVTEEQNIDKTWADVQTQYQRRFDLIPNLVETVKGYATHEKETFENVTLARTGLSDAYSAAEALRDNAAHAETQSFEKYNASQSELQKALSIYVNAVKEAYPDLKANQQFLSLQDQLEGTENRIAESRRKYTEAVQSYNVRVKRFPGNVFAGIFGFAPKAQFEAEASAQTAPKVQF